MNVYQATQYLPRRTYSPVPLQRATLRIGGLVRTFKIKFSGLMSRWKMSLFQRNNIPSCIAFTQHAAHFETTYLERTIRQHSDSR